jgi:hypothetical protein
MYDYFFKEAVTISSKALFQNFYWRKSAKTLNQGGCIRTQDHQHMYEQMCGNIQAYTTHCVQNETLSNPPYHSK